MTTPPPTVGVGVRVPDESPSAEMQAIAVKFKVDGQNADKDSGIGET